MFATSRALKHRNFSRHFIRLRILRISFPPYVSGYARCVPADTQEIF